MITIVNYGLGNLGSIQNMLKKIGVMDVLISNNPDDILNADKLILPGVGAFDAGMSKINELGLVPLLNQAVLEQKKPVLGICLGMQLMTLKSEEGQLNGLSWMNAEVKKFQFENSELKVPHMGWNFVDIKDSDLKMNLIDPSRFYFVHSYYIQCHDENDVSITCQYGHDFVAGFRKDNMMGVQFHPEKSHKYGMELMRYFVEKF